MSSIFERSVTVSANTLFHFTNKGNLIEILKSNFVPHYSLENFNMGGGELLDGYLAIPMVSFCDIPLSHIRDHVRKYGSYALGLTKEWAKSNGISPVIYAYPGALSTNAVLRITDSVLQTELTTASGLKQVNHLSYLFKPYEGKLFRDGKFYTETVRFYDEREWRYIPPLNVLMTGKVNAFLSKPDYDNKTFLKTEHDKLRTHCPLVFEPKFIRYVIIEQEAERLDMMKTISDIKSPNFPTEDVLALTSRIISLEQIKGDF